MSSSTAAPPPDLRAAVTARLTDELGDAGLAAGVVAELGDGVLDGLLGGDGAAGVGTSPLLAFSPSTVPPVDLDALVVFAFGNRVASDGTVTAGPMNEALAGVTAELVASRPRPVFAQWEVARLLTDAGVPGVVSIEPRIADDGTVVYLSTVGVAEAAADLAAEVGVAPHRVGVLAFADHAVRAQLTARAVGLAADVPSGVVLPSTYDPESGQPWTRDRQGYVVTDLQGRLLLSG